MAKRSKTGGRLTIGIDLGDRISEVCVLNERSEVIEQSRLVTSPESFERRFGSCAPALIAVETGTHSPWVKNLLESFGHEVLVANTRKVRLISQNRRKSDRVDAEFLARMARVDPQLLAPIQHRSKSYQVDLALVRARATLVASRTQLVNYVRGSAKALGARLRKCSASSFHRKAFAQIPAELAGSLKPVLEAIGTVTEKIRELDRQIEEVSITKYPVTQLFREINGVGPKTALCFTLTLEDPHRFRKSRAVGAYLGLVPRRQQSGGRDPQLRITKQGDVQLRSLLVQCAQYILGPHGADSDLRRAGKALAAHGAKNAKKRAVVAVARRLAVLMLSLWKTGEVYEALRHSTTDKAVA